MERTFRKDPEGRPNYPSLLSKAEKEEEGHIMQDDVIFKKISIRNFEWLAAVVPLALRNEILQAYHKDSSAGHFGVHLTYEMIRRRYFWPGMKKDIRASVRDCLTCVLSKAPSGKQAGIMGTVHSDKPNQTLCLDHIVTSGSSQKKMDPHDDGFNNSMGGD